MSVQLEPSQPRASQCLNKGKLKVLVQALKEIVDELESEVYADEDVLAFTPPPEDYDEVFND